MSRVLPDQKGLIHGQMLDAAVDSHDSMYAEYMIDDHEDVVSMYEECVENVTMTDTQQLEQQVEIGIASAHAKWGVYTSQCLNLLWLRQMLYGKPFPVLLHPDTLKAVIPFLDKHSIRIEWGI